MDKNLRVLNEMKNGTENSRRGNVFSWITDTDRSD
jgi:hypothetical protein